MSIEALIEKLIATIESNTQAILTSKSDQPPAVVNLPVVEQPPSPEEPTPPKKKAPAIPEEVAKLVEETTQTKELTGRQKKLLDRLEKRVHATKAQAAQSIMLNVPDREDRKALVEHFKPGAKKLDQLEDLGVDIWTRVIDYVEERHIKRAN